MAHLNTLGISQVELSRRLWIDPRTVRAWASGRAKAPIAVLLLLDAWELHPELERRHKVMHRRTKQAETPFHG